MPSPKRSPTIRQAVGLQTKGIKELTAQLRALKDVTVSKEVASMLGTQGNQFRKLAYQNARTRNWPSEILKNEGFVDARWPQSRRGKNSVSILFGFRKQFAPGYVEWYGKPQGRIIGMSLATLYEFGGEHRPQSTKPRGVWLAARPAFRPAIAYYRLIARGKIREAMKGLISRYVRDTTASPSIPFGSTAGNPFNG